MTTWNTHYIKSPTGTHLRYAIKKSHSENADKQITIFFMQGRNECVEKYFGIEKFFPNSNEITWITWDHRGQGDSSGERAHIDTYDDYVSDTAFIIDHFTKGDTYFVIAHSMGGLIALKAALQNAIKPLHLFLCSPLLLLPNKPIPRPIAKILAGLVSKTKQAHHSTEALINEDNDFHNNLLTSSYKGFMKIQSSRYSVSAPSYKWVYASFIACQDVNKHRNITSLNCPVTVFGGSEERVVDYSGFASWVNRAKFASNQCISFHNIVGARHELLNEKKCYTKQVTHKIFQTIQKSLEKLNAL